MFEHIKEVIRSCKPKLNRQYKKRGQNENYYKTLHIKLKYVSTVFKLVFISIG